MENWLLLLAVVTAGSLLSLIGGIYLIYGKKGAAKVQKLAVPFAAGALLAAAFLDLLPEASEQTAGDQVMLAALMGFVGFFVLERSLAWFHHHHDDGDQAPGGRKRTTSLIVIGDTVHNFIDGLAIGAAFLVSPATGIITALAIAAHEIPQEIGDFGLMLSKGMKKNTVLLVNIVSALATVVGAALVYGLGDALPIDTGILLAITAGFFIYIAASDIIPTIHAEPRGRWADIQTVVLIVGIVVVGLAATSAHRLVPHVDDAHHIADHDHHDK